MGWGGRASDNSSTRLPFGHKVVRTPDASLCNEINDYLIPYRLQNCFKKIVKIFFISKYAHDVTIIKIYSHCARCFYIYFWYERQTSVKFASKNIVCKKAAILFRGGGGGGGSEGQTMRSWNTRCSPIDIKTMTRICRGFWQWIHTLSGR